MNQILIKLGIETSLTSKSVLKVSTRGGEGGKGMVASESPPTISEVPGIF